MWKSYTGPKDAQFWGLKTWGEGPGAWGLGPGSPLDPHLDYHYKINVIMY